MTSSDRFLTFFKDEKDIMLKILGVVDEFRESGVTCKNLDTETKNLANDNTLLQVGHRGCQVLFISSFILIHCLIKEG